MKNPLIELVAAVGIALAIALSWAWYNRPEPVKPGAVVVSPPAQEVKKEDKFDVPVKTVKAYKPGVKGKLKLPEAVAADTNQHVIASSQTVADEHPHTITTVINQQTGEATTYDRKDPLPWLAANTKTELGVYYGIKHGEQAIRIEGRQELLQVKALHFGAVASADMTRSLGTDTFFGVGMWARW